MAFNSMQRPSLSGPPPPPSSSSSQKWLYDVFLSFRGKDTLKTFVNHLYAALDLKGVVSFRYDRIEKGVVMPLELLKAVKKSRFSIIVFSKNYASSMCCLDELAQILECMREIGQTVFPIFYDVGRSEVRNQTGSFEEAFASHEEMFRDNIEKVQRWRASMSEIAEIKGWHLKDRNESEIIHEIVKEISSKLNHTFPGLPKELVGIGLRMEEVIMHLNMESDDVRVIGICGMGGIGKTTIARVVYERISFQFEGSSFVANVREVSEKSGLVALQKQLLSEILMDGSISIWDVFRGANAIRNRLCRKKILLILDDVDQLEQLENLAGQHDWFGSGSRIIITTRDEHLLNGHGVDTIYMAKELNQDESLMLFSWRAFKKDHPEKEYLKLSQLVASYVNGLPLALEVLGSFLFGRTISEWQSAVGRLEKVPNKNILEILKISYDGLEEMEREIFLDIACFFKGDFKGQVSRKLASFGFYPDIGIRVLADKSLITVSDDILWMHDLLQEMGCEIVRQESPKEPGKRSRLWHCRDVYDVLLNNKGTDVVQGLVLNSVGLKQIHLDADAFSKMDRLRLLSISNVDLPQGLKYLSNELRVLKWLGYPSKSFPSSFQPEKLVELNLRSSCIEELWNMTKPLVKLKIMKLSYCKNLRKTPDFRAVPNLEILILEGCTGLSEIHASITGLYRLMFLNLKDCSSLRSLPGYIYMQYLSTLDLSGCTKLKMFPEIIGKMEHLSKLSLAGTAIGELPLTIQHLTGLVYLNLRDCESLVSLPSVICSLKSLKVLNLSGCSKLDKLPENLGHLLSLEELDIGGTAIRETPASIKLLKNLKVLSFRGCNILPHKPWISPFLSPLMQKNSPQSVALSLPSLLNFHSLTDLDLSNCNLSTGLNSSSFGGLTSLVKLNLSGNNFVSLPASISQLTKLAELNLNKCKRLQSLPALPPSLEAVLAEDCTSLGIFPSQSSAFNSGMWGFSFINCYRFAEIQGGCSLTFILLKRYLKSQNWLQVGVPFQFAQFNIALPGSKIPLWFMHQKMGASLSIEVPPHWCSTDFLGVAVSAVFGVMENSAVSRDNSASGTYRQILCRLDTDVGVMDPGAVFPISSDICIKSDHLWLCFQPRRMLPTYADEWWKCNHIEASFESTVPGLEVKKCGLRLVYKLDIEEILQHDFDESLAESAIIRRSYDNDSHHEEAESIRSGDADRYLCLTSWKLLINPMFELTLKYLPAILVGFLLLILWKLPVFWLL